MQGREGEREREREKGMGERDTLQYYSSHTALGERGTEIEKTKRLKRDGRWKGGRKREVGRGRQQI